MTELEINKLITALYRQNELIDRQNKLQFLIFTAILKYTDLDTDAKGWLAKLQEVEDVMGKYDDEIRKGDVM